MLQVLKRSMESCHQSQAQKPSQYKVTVVGSAVESNPDILGILFKLHPKGTQEFAKAKYKATETAKQSSTDTQQPEASV